MGVAVAQPFTFLYGSDGFVGWSDINLPRVYGTRQAGSDRITDNKIVYASAVRGAQVPTMMFWSINSLIRGTYSLGPTLFSFNTVTAKTSILSSRSVAEVNSVFMWPGINRFNMYDGVVRELPNNHSLDWFYDNLNWEYRQKIWSTVNYRFGEIWWMFPYGTNTECSHAVIFNFRDRVWYDTELPVAGRYGGTHKENFRWPVFGSSNNGLWLHEFGVNKIENSVVDPIQSFYKTGDFALTKQGIDRSSKITELEFDFKNDQGGEMELTIETRKRPRSTTRNSRSYTIAEGADVWQDKINGKIVNFKFSSNVQDGYYEAGQHLLRIGPDDGR